MGLSHDYSLVRVRPVTSKRLDLLMVLVLVLLTVLVLLCLA
jgi:hypothetical protein